MSTGLSGTPMPSFKDSLPEQDRWALAYYVLSLSAFKDPLTGEPLQISDATRKALDNPKLEANTPGDAYVPGGAERGSASAADTASAEPTGALVRGSGNAVPQKNE
jgi:cytochrome c oxidase cbb3-type subunit 2